MTNSPSMRRGVLCIVLAAAFSLGGAQHPQPKSNGEQTQAAQVERSSAQIADAIRQSRPEKDNGCEDRKDNRGSDLCARWSAVDAARNAARATWAAVILSFAGTFLIFLTFTETYRTNRRELRAYVFRTRFFVQAHVDGESGHRHWEVAPVWVNQGKTPARDVRLQSWRYYDSLPMPEDFAFDTLDPNTLVYDIGPGSDLYGIPVTFTVDEFRAIKTGAAFGYVWGWARYKDVFEDTERVTKFCNRVEPSGDLRPTGTGEVHIKFYGEARHKLL